METEIIAPHQGHVEQISRAEIDTQIATAKRYPRDIPKVLAKMRGVACLDEETAASCFYALPRGGKTIKGPSVRLAEIALSSYGNVRAMTRVSETVTEGPHPHVVVTGSVIDVENNLAVQIEKRRRITKKRNKDHIDDDDINLAVNSCAAIAFRDAVFKVIPGSLVNKIYRECEKVAIGDAKSFAHKRDTVLSRLQQMGADQKTVLKFLRVDKPEDIDSDMLSTLIGAGTAIKDGELTVEQAFTPEEKKEDKDEIPMDFGNGEKGGDPPEKEEAPPAAKKTAKKKTAKKKTAKTKTAKEREPAAEETAAPTATKDDGFGLQAEVEGDTEEARMENLTELDGRRKDEGMSVAELRAACKQIGLLTEEQELMKTPASGLAPILNRWDEVVAAHEELQQEGGE